MSSGASMSISGTSQKFEVECQKCGLLFNVPIDRFKDKAYIHWLKASLCVQYTKEGLEDFVGTISREFYETIKHDVEAANNCISQCSLNNFNLKHFKCPSKTCDTLRKALIDSSRKHRLQLENTTLADMLLSPENVSKLFMPRMYKIYNGPQQADITALLALMGECLPINSKLQDSGAVNAVRESRNAIMHSGTMRIDEHELSQHTRNFIALLSDPCYLKKDNKCTQAIKRINEVYANRLQINLVELESNVMAQHNKHLHDEIEELNLVVASTTCTADELESTKRRVKELEENEMKRKVLMDFYNIDTTRTKSFLTTAGKVHQQTDSKLDELKLEAKDNAIGGLRRLLKTEQESNTDLATEREMLRAQIDKLQTDHRTIERELRDHIKNLTKDLQDVKSRSSILQGKLLTDVSRVSTHEKHVDAERNRTDELQNTLEVMNSSIIDLSEGNADICSEGTFVRSTTPTVYTPPSQQELGHELQNSHAVDTSRKRAFQHRTEADVYIAYPKEMDENRKDSLKLQMDDSCEDKYESHANQPERKLENTRKNEAEQNVGSHNADDKRTDDTSSDAGTFEVHADSSRDDVRSSTPPVSTSQSTQQNANELQYGHGLVSTKIRALQNDIGKGRTEADADITFSQDMNDTNTNPVKLQMEMSGENKYERHSNQSEHENTKTTETEQDVESHNAYDNRTDDVCCGAGTSVESTDCSRTASRSITPPIATRLDELTSSGDWQKRHDKVTAAIWTLQGKTDADANATHSKDKGDTITNSLKLRTNYSGEDKSETHSNQSEHNSENTRTPETEQDVELHNADDRYTVEPPSAGAIAVFHEGYLNRKSEMKSTSIKAKSRSWDKVCVVVRGRYLSCYKDQKHAQQDPSLTFRHEPTMDLNGAACALATDYTRRANVFRLTLATGAAYLFEARDQAEMISWIDVIIRASNMDSFHGLEFTSPMYLKDNV